MFGKKYRKKEVEMGQCRLTKIYAILPATYTTDATVVFTKCDVAELSKDHVAHQIGDQDHIKQNHKIHPNASRTLIYNSYNSHCC